MLSMTRRLLVAFALLGAFASAAGAQTTETTPYWASMLSDLPAGGNFFSVLETAQPEVTTDRFNNGGLNAGVPDKASAFLASWSQTLYRISGINVSSPIDGTPMLFPDLTWWDMIAVSPSRRALIPGATGLAIDFSPRSPTHEWTGMFEGFGSGGALTQTSPVSKPPAATQLGDFAHVAALTSGYVIRNKVGISIGASYTRATTFETRGEKRRDTASLFVNTTTQLTEKRHVDVMALVQQHARHVQAIYEHSSRSGLFAGYTDLTRNVEPLPEFQQVDRVSDGPMPSLINSRSTERRWVVGSRSSQWYGRQMISVGLDAERSAATAAPIGLAIIAERVAGIPARLWRFSSPARDSRRHAWMINAFFNDYIKLGGSKTLEGEVRFDSADASADGAVSGISWHTVLPAVRFRWTGTPWQLEFSTELGRVADQPLLNMLSYGDPNAATADVFRWNGENTAASPLTMRVGPGTSGDPDFSAIDPHLKRPVTDQFVLQLTSHPTSSLMLRVTGLARRQSSRINIVNIGVPVTGYSMFTIPDANADWVNPKDDQQLPVYNRSVDSFGRDRYLLTNPDVEDATTGAVVVEGELSNNTVLFRIGGTASASVGSGGSRGYTAIENDPSILGELFTNPNAATYARGRLFNDRAYTIKSLAIVQLPVGMKAGATARFQDGQPFTRLAVVPDLNQGAEAIQTFSRGRSRFSYRATLDVRLQKRINFGRSHVDVIADAYNLLNASSEVEEDVVTGPRFREITAIQPPRSFHLGARVTF
jgi:hypothetical protein